MPAFIQYNGEDMCDVSENGEELLAWADMVDEMCGGKAEAFPYPLWLEWQFSPDEYANRTSTHWGFRSDHGLPPAPGGRQILTRAEWIRTK